jgi:hypothetical protein
LSAAIWRVLLEQKEIHPEKLSRVVEYVRKQVDKYIGILLSYFSPLVYLLPKTFNLFATIE